MPMQILSSFIPQKLAKRRNRNARTVSAAGSKQFKRTRLIQIGITVVMCGIVAFSATGVGIYWFFSAFFSVLQTLIMHAIIVRNRSKGGTLENKLDKFFEV
jgi:YidC/Oxa1 family membrane protein insertase